MGLGVLIVSKAVVIGVILRISLNVSKGGGFDGRCLEES